MNLGTYTVNSGSSYVRFYQYEFIRNNGLHAIYLKLRTIFISDDDGFMFYSVLTFSRTK